MSVIPGAASTHDQLRASRSSELEAVPAALRRCLRIDRTVVSSIRGVRPVEKTSGPGQGSSGRSRMMESSRWRSMCPASAGRVLGSITREAAGCTPAERRVGVPRTWCGRCIDRLPGGRFQRPIRRQLVEDTSTQIRTRSSHRWRRGARSGDTPGLLGGAVQGLVRQHREAALDAPRQLLEDLQEAQLVHAPGSRAVAVLSVSTPARLISTSSIFPGTSARRCALACVAPRAR